MIYIYASMHSCMLYQCTPFTTLAAAILTHELFPFALISTNIVNLILN